MAANGIIETSVSPWATPMVMVRTKTGGWPRVDFRRLNAFAHNYSYPLPRIDALIHAPVLAYPDPNQPFLVDTDASNVGIGAVLSQRGEAGERVVTYYSCSPSRPEINYCITRQELLAVVLAVHHFRPYLLGTKFALRTDHGSLTWMLNFHQPEVQVAR